MYDCLVVVVCAGMMGSYVTNIFDSKHNKNIIVIEKKII